MKSLGKLYSKINLVLRILAVFLLFCMSVLLVVNVICRYFLSFSLTWVAELSRYLMVWAAFLSMPVLVFGDNHLKMDFIIELFPLRLKKIFLVIIQLVSITFYLVVMFYGVVLIKKTGSQQASSIPFQMNLIYAVIPFSAFLMSSYSVSRLVNIIKGK